MNTVSLEFESSRVFVSEAQSVLFFARRGDSVVRCYVTLKALVTYFGADEEADENETCLRTYDAHRGAIQRVARHMLDDRERAGSRVVVITTSEVFRDMVYGHLAEPTTARERLAEMGHG
jgi:hypothetical protein